MLACILILVNILIAHLSNAYTDASARAKIQCDIDRAVLITKLERTVFRWLVSIQKAYQREINECRIVVEHLIMIFHLLVWKKSIYKHQKKNLNS